MHKVCSDHVQARISRFVRETFVGDVSADANAVAYSVDVRNPEWLMNDHFPGTSIIQSFFQGAMLLFCENQPTFDPDKSMFFLGGIKIKFMKPIFLGAHVKFSLACTAFTSNVLLFEGSCIDNSGKTYARISGSLSIKDRANILEASEISRYSGQPESTLA